MQEIFARNIKKNDRKVKKIEKDTELLKINGTELQKQVLDLKLQIEKLKPITEKMETGNQTGLLSVSVVQKFA